MPEAVEFMICPRGCLYIAAVACRHSLRLVRDGLCGGSLLVSHHAFDHGNNNDERCCSKGCNK